MFCCCLVIIGILLAMWNRIRIPENFQLFPGNKTQSVSDAPRGSINFPGGPRVKVFGTNPLPLVLDSDIALG